MANELDGREIYLIINDTILVNEQGLTNNETADTLETTNKHTVNKRKTFIPSETTGTISANGSYCITDPNGYIGYHAIKALMKANTQVNYEIGKFAAGGKIESGTAIITACNLSANRGSLVTFDITLQKTGDYSEDTYES